MICGKVASCTIVLYYKLLYYGFGTCKDAIAFFLSMVMLTCHLDLCVIKHFFYATCILQVLKQITPFTWCEALPNQQHQEHLVQQAPKLQLLLPVALQVVLEAYFQALMLLELLVAGQQVYLGLDFRN